MSSTAAAAAAHLGRVSLRSFVAAALAVALAVAAVARFGIGGRALVAVFLVGVLVLLSAIDLERRILPNAIVLPSAALVLVVQSLLFPDRAFEWILAGLLAALFLFLPLLVYPTGMGMGDVKLALLLGAALGRHVFVALVIALVAVFVASVFLIARDGVSARKATIPFGPFLAFGAVAALFFGESVADALGLL